MTNSALVDRAAQHHPVRGAANQPLNPGVLALFDLHRPHDCGPVSYPRAARPAHRPHGTVADQVRRPSGSQDLSPSGPRGAGAFGVHRRSVRKPIGVTSNDAAVLRRPAVVWRVVFVAAVRRSWQHQLLRGRSNRLLRLWLGDAHSRHSFSVAISIV